MRRESELELSDGLCPRARGWMAWKASLVLRHAIIFTFDQRLHYIDIRYPPFCTCFKARIDSRTFACRTSMPDPEDYRALHGLVIRSLAY